ncbi:NifB/NifX family molybdenum-iron cluster-binding protein [Desulfococcus sp.]|uniref:NifB/NifX family molybdenum-iron cluster-binding protein n=1 Tax=Desulfococcus sp. TaxID=2025834 RepID=UPI0035941BF0
MKIAISTSGKTLDSDVEPRFGRSPGFILFDTDTQNVQYLDNAAQQNLSQGAGIQTAQMIAEAGTQVVITGQVGPKAAQVLDQSKIKIHACAGGTVREALKALDENALKAFSLDDAAQVVPNKPGDQDMGGVGRGRGPGQGGRGMGGGGGQGRR